MSDLFSEKVVYFQKLRIDKFSEPCGIQKISNSNDAAAICRNFFDTDTIEIYESASVVFFNKANKPIAWAELSRGGISGTVVDIKIMLTHGILAGASAMILCHNHPSGNLRPSEADTVLTQKAKKAGELVDILLLDHVILTKEGYYSFADNGLL